MNQHGNGLVIWKCPKKHPCLTGFLPPLASTLRFCKAETGWDGEAEIVCGSEMEVVYDERPKPLGPITEGASDNEKRRRIAIALRSAGENLRGGEMMAAQIVTQLGLALRGIKGGKK